MTTSPKSNKQTVISVWVTRCIRRQPSRDCRAKYTFHACPAIWTTTTIYSKKTLSIANSCIISLSLTWWWGMRPMTLRASLTSKRSSVTASRRSISPRRSSSHFGRTTFCRICTREQVFSHRCKTRLLLSYTSSMADGSGRDSAFKSVMLLAVLRTWLSSTRSCLRWKLLRLRSTKRLTSQYSEKTKGFWLNTTLETSRLIASPKMSSSILETFCKKWYNRVTPCHTWSTKQVTCPC